MQLLPVYEHHKLGKDNLWATICSKVVELLNQQNIQHSSVDLVHFSWVEENKDIKDDKDNKDNKDNKDVNIKVALYRTVVTTLATIWVGVLPDTLPSKEAFHSSNDILDLLKEHGIFDVDVAYHELVARDFSGPELFAPISDLDPLKAVINPVTTALGLPITGLKMLKSQGTMGFYFRVDKVLYAITACHILFPEDESNSLYSYIARPKKEVVFIGTKAFTNFLISIQGHIGTLNNMVGILEKWVMALMVRSEGSGPNTDQAAGELVETQRKLGKTRTAIEELKKFFMKMKKEWMEPKDRIIGHVVWAPPVSVSTAPHSYTKDVCIIKLDEKKFSQNFRGNMLNLGSEINTTKFISLMYPHFNVPSNFDYPVERLLTSGKTSRPEMSRTL